MHSSLIGSFSLETLPKTSDDAQTWTTGSLVAFFFIASKSFAVPNILVFKVSMGESKLVFG